MYDYQFINDLIQFGVHTRTLIITLDGIEILRADCDFKNNETNLDMNNYAEGVIATLQSQAGG